MVVKSKEFPVKSIQKYQRKCKFDYHRPTNFVEKPVIPLANLKYDVNLVNDSTDYCLRYSFFTGRRGATYWIYDNFNSVNFWNLTQGDSTAAIYKSQYNDSLLIDKFNSDLAGFVDFDIKSSYGKGYTYCTMITIHKNKVANLYMTLLYNDKDSLVYNKMFNDAVNSIRF